MTTAKVEIICHDQALQEEAAHCEQQLRLLGYLSKGADYALLFENGCVKLCSLHEKTGDIIVTFESGAAAHRRKFGGGLGQAVAKACGLSGSFKPSLFDATAGLGQDAFVLASLGCSVTLMERSPIAFALLADGLRRARNSDDPELVGIAAHMTLLEGNSTQYLAADSCKVDVVYLDPMFPAKQKSAASKKEMSVFQTLVGADLDEHELLDAALIAAEYRVVVKRPRLAHAIAGRSPSASIKGKSSRFDIYGLKKLPG